MCSVDQVCFVVELSDSLFPIVASNRGYQNASIDRRWGCNTCLGL